MKVGMSFLEPLEVKACFHPEFMRVSMYCSKGQPLDLQPGLNYQSLVHWVDYQEERESYGPMDLRNYA